MKKTNWRDKYKDMEQAYMVTKDQYSEVARALGFDSNEWFGDPIARHEEIVERAACLYLHGCLP